MTTTDVHTLEERDGAARAGRALEIQRHDASEALLANRPSFDIANLTDEEFDAGLARVELRQKRMAKILDTVLHEGVHFGNPLTKDGKPVFPKKILYQAGAEELRNLFRLKLRHVVPPVVVETDDYCSVTVTLGVEDGAGRILAPRSGSCNTMEKRFERRDGKGYTYKDAREMLHQCFAMAEKRAGAFATKEVTGANAFFASDDEDAMRAALGIEEEAVSPPWTAEEKKAFGVAAKKAGMALDNILPFIAKVLGSDRAVLQSDIPTLNEALTAWQAEKVTAVKKAGFESEEKAEAGAPAEAGDAAE